VDDGGSVGLQRHATTFHASLISLLCGSNPPKACSPFEDLMDEAGLAKFEKEASFFQKHSPIE
jgi:hypothetical protein